MTRVSHCLTQRDIDRLAATGRRYRKYDRGSEGLFVRVTEKGAKSYGLRVSGASGQAEHTLGPCGAISLVAARKLAAEKREEIIRERVMPLTRPAPLLREVVEEWKTSSRVRALATTSWAGYADKLDRFILPRFGDVQINKITRGDFAKEWLRIANRNGPRTASQCRMVAGLIFGFALDFDYVDGNTPQLTRNPGKKGVKKRYLIDREMQALWLQLDAKDFNHKLSEDLCDILAFILVTGQRRKEVAQIVWGEVDLQRHVWTIPAARAKNGVEHEIYLGSIALGILERRLPKNAPAMRQPIWPMRLDNIGQACRRIGRAHEEEFNGIFGPHDLRRSFATGLQRLRTPKEIADACLNHKPDTRHAVSVVR